MSDPTPHDIYELGDFALDAGVTLPNAQIAYATYGRINAARDNVIVFPSWFTGTHLDLEWMIGDGRPLDTTKYFVIAPSMFGNGLSSSPSNTPAPYDRGRFPAITIQDNVRAQHRLLTERFDVQHIQLAIGGSMGAFQAYQWGLAYPDLVERIAPCCGAARVSPHCYVFLEGAKAALTADQKLDGRRLRRPARDGVAGDGARLGRLGGLAAVLSRRPLSAHGIQRRRDVPRRLLGGVLAEARRQQPLEPAAHLADRRHLEIARLRWRPRAGARAIRAKAVLSPGEKDLYFPPEDMAWEAEQMPNAELRVIPGPWGHFSEVGIDASCNEFLGNSIRMLLAR